MSTSEDRRDLHPTPESVLCQPSAVDHPDTLPLSYMQKKRERKMDQVTKAFLLMEEQMNQTVEASQT
ncbi:hypothetical protein R6Z07F_007891 [Ovis aries]